MNKLPKNLMELSKYLSYILRHNPSEADIELDEKGYATLSEVLKSMKNTKYAWVSKEDIIKLINESDKERFEIKKGKIRARYGHSVDIDLKDTCIPPNNLFHGTSPRSYKSIKREGLKPMDRKYVHLSKNLKDAYKVVKRHYP
ncbi:MAG: RNA 2'-phosphotransferase [Thermoplasmatota archaeon]